MNERTVRQHKILPDVFPESWASDWGEDEYGLFMGFTYKGVRQDFRWIEPGTFLMGSPKDEPDRTSMNGEYAEIQHEVILLQGFWVADTTVTQVLWEAVMGENPANFKGENRPVEQISWDEAQEFIQRMNGMKPELQLCLPSEAEWEYCCRAGTETPFSFGDQISSELVNFDGNYPYNNGRKSEGRGETVVVKSLPPNAWGLYEMHGNVYEWCQDKLSHYPAQSIVDPIQEAGLGRVLRGGSWFDLGRRCRSADRHANASDSRSYRTGFRLARGHRAVQSGTG